MARTQRSSIVHDPESRDNSTSPRTPHPHRRIRNVSSSASLWPKYQNPPATSGRLLTQPEFDATSQKNKQAFYYNSGTKELGQLEPGSTVRIPSIVNNGPKQRLTDKLVYAHTKLSLTAEGCIAGTADTCDSMPQGVVKPQSTPNP